MNVTVCKPVIISGKGFVFQNDYNFSLDYYKELKKVLRIKRVKNFPFVRLGRPTYDGGYLMADNFCGNIAYSFGICDDVTWDLDAVRRGYEVFQYDMTIDALPVENEHFHFFREGIGAVKDPENSLDTLENFVIRNGHFYNRNMILKMDVEGAEWGFIQTVPNRFLNRFDQMVFEFHNLIQTKNLLEMGLTIELLKKINETHTLVHLHANNNGTYLNFENFGIFPDTLELTYLRTDNYIFEDDENIFLPLELDRTNHPALPEIQLGYWNKISY